MAPCRFPALVVILAALAAPGCGTTKSQLATEQLLISDAVDRAVATIDFSELKNERVFFDDRYLKAVKGFGFVNADYIASSLRQQLVASGCLLQDTMADADIVVEARVGALGSDNHDVTFGVPPSRLLSTAAQLVPNAPPIPVIPEVSVGKRNDKVGAAKIGVFAYHRETREPVWQAGISEARSSARDLWLMGAGPFQSGTIHDKTRFAGRDLKLPVLKDGEPSDDPLQDYVRARSFRAGEPESASEVLPATYEVQDEDEDEDEAKPPSGGGEEASPPASDSE